MPGSFLFVPSRGPGRPPCPALSRPPWPAQCGIGPVITGPMPHRAGSARPGPRSGGTGGAPVARPGGVAAHDTGRARNSGAPRARPMWDASNPRVAVHDKKAPWPMSDLPDFGEPDSRAARRGSLEKSHAGVPGPGPRASGQHESGPRLPGSTSWAPGFGAARGRGPCLGQRGAPPRTWGSTAGGLASGRHGLGLWLPAVRGGRRCIREVVLTWPTGLSRMVNVRIGSHRRLFAGAAREGETMDDSSAGRAGRRPVTAGNRPA